MGPGHRTIGILLFDDVEELDAVGPWDVLGAWTGFFPEDGWRVTTLSREGGYVRAAKGLGMVAAESATSCPPLDIVVHPGGDRALVPSWKTKATSSGFAGSPNELS